MNAATSPSAASIADTIKVLIARPAAYLAGVLEHPEPELSPEMDGMTAGLIELAVRLRVLPEDGPLEGESQVQTELERRRALSLDEHYVEGSISAEWYEWVNELEKSHS
jgi:hypothetical protein